VDLAGKSIWYLRPIQSEGELPVTMTGDICEIVVGHADHYLALIHYQVQGFHFL
jgi:hypothetical protein